MINPNSPYTCQRVGKCSYESMSNRCMYCGKTKEEILEYSMKVPNYILEMAMKVENWFIDNKIPKWRLMGMVSRNHIHIIDQYKEKLEAIKKLANDKIYE